MEKYQILFRWHKHTLDPTLPQIINTTQHSESALRCCAREALLWLYVMLDGASTNRTFIGMLFNGPSVHSALMFHDICNREYHIFQLQLPKRVYTATQQEYLDITPASKIQNKPAKAVLDRAVSYEGISAIFKKVRKFSCWNILPCSLISTAPRKGIFQNWLTEDYNSYRQLVSFSCPRNVEESPLLVTSKHFLSRP